MTTDEIRELIRVVKETGIAELEVRRGENMVRIRTSAPVNQEIVMPAVVSLPVATAAPQAATPVATPSGESSAAAAASAAKEEEERDMVVTSPIVGTYYDSPAPGAAPFVRVGDRVELQQVLCIIESMKLMNEILAETAGTIVAKHSENGRPVEYGQSLFTVRPS